VRELKNAIERACILVEGAMISERELTSGFDADPAPTSRLRTPDARPTKPEEPPAALEDIERGHIIDVLRQVDGNRMAAAKILGISRRALYRRLERHKILDEVPQAFGRRT
jgi:two-component system response regulator AtoC